MDILITRRLTLRPPLEVDAEPIVPLLAKANVARNLSSVPHPYQLTDAERWIADCKADGRSLHFTLHRDRLIGVCSVKLENGCYNLGYWLDEAAWGEGLMTEAARAVLAHAFRKLGTEEIVSGAYADNPASMAILKKLGFQPSHTVNDLNPTRGKTVPCDKVVLTRQAFEKRFGPLEVDAAA